MSIHMIAKGKYRVRWREGGRNKSTVVDGPRALAVSVEAKKKTERCENRHLDIKREINFRMTALIDQYWESVPPDRRSGKILLAGRAGPGADDGFSGAGRRGIRRPGLRCDLLPRYGQ